MIASYDRDKLSCTRSAGIYQCKSINLSEHKDALASIEGVVIVIKIPRLRCNVIVRLTSHWQVVEFFTWLRVKIIVSLHSGLEAKQRIPFKSNISSINVSKQMIFFYLWMQKLRCLVSLQLLTGFCGKVT